MICPLLTIGSTLQDQPGIAPYPCLHKNCAWYDTDYDRCGILTIARAILSVKAAVLIAADKEPRGDPTQ